MEERFGIRDPGFNDPFGLSREEDVLSEDVDSMDVHSRTEDSLTSDLQFQEQLQQVVSSAPSSRKRTKKTSKVQRNHMADMGPKSRARPRKPNEVHDQVQNIQYWWLSQRYKLNNFINTLFHYRY